MICTDQFNVYYHLGPPSAPGTPQSLEITHDSLTLYWKQPQDNGQSDIIEYILEYKEVQSEKYVFNLSKYMSLYN